MRLLVPDLSRLLTGLRFPGPTGVETLELGLARHLPDGPGLVLTPWGARLAGPATRRRIAAAAARRWREDAPAGDDELAAIAAFLRGARLAPAPLPPVRSLLAAARFAPALIRPARRLPEGAATLHAGFFRLERSRLFDFRRRRPDLRMIVAFHDTLPLDHPEWFRPSEDSLHRARLETTLRTADAIAVPAAPVAEALARHAAALGLMPPRVATIALPVSPRFATAEPPAFAAPYVLICGTIEPRKNHAVLLEAWRRMGPRAPKLVIAGRRGWRNDAVFRALDARPDSILEAPGLSSGALARLVRGAAALLSPSLDEGYGLPVAEALSAGTPVIAADTPIYRALWAGRVRLIHPTDADAWAEAALKPPPRAAPYIPTDWRAYAAALTALAAST